MSADPVRAKRKGRALMGQSEEEGNPPLPVATADGAEPEGKGADSPEPEGERAEPLEPEGKGAEPLESEEEGAEALETGPERRCIVTGERQPKERMIRFVLDPERRIVPDLAENLPGRGLWVTAERASVDQAARKGRFARAARQAVTVAPDLSAQVETLLVQRCQHLIGLARRAGLAVAGFVKVQAALAQAGKTGGILITAADASPEGRRKLLAMADQATVLAPVLTAAELGAPFGRAERVHVWIGPGGLTGRIRREVQRLAGLRGADS